MSFYRVRPIVSRVRKRLSRSSFDSHAAEVVNLDRGRYWSARPLLHPDGELQRIVGHHADSDPNGNLERISCKEVWQGPTQALLFKDVMIADATLLLRNSFKSIRSDPRRLIASRIQERYETAAFCSTFVSERYFGHWLRDQLGAELLARDNNLTAITLKGTHRPNERGYRSLLNQHANKVTTALVNELWIYNDSQITDHRIDRLRRLRQRLRSSVKSSSLETVFIARGDSAVGRTLVNEREVIAALNDLGVQPIYPEKMEPREIVAALKGARLVIGPEGSAFSHALMTVAPGTTLVQIQGAQHFNMGYRIYCEGMNLNLGVLIGAPVENEGFNIDVQRVKNFTEQLLERKL